MKLVIRRERVGYYIRAKDTYYYIKGKLKLISEKIAVTAGEIKAGTYEVEKVMLSSISGWNRTWQKGLIVGPNTPILLSKDKLEPWIMIKGSGIGWPEKQLSVLAKRTGQQRLGRKQGTNSLIGVTSPSKSSRTNLRLLRTTNNNRRT